MSKRYELPEGRYELKKNWLGGNYQVMDGTKVWFGHEGDQAYMEFREGKVKVVWQIFEQPAFSFWFQKTKPEDKEPTALNLDDKCLSLNDVMDCIYTWEEIKKQHLAHSHTFYRNDLKNNHPLIIRLKEKLKSQIKEPTAFQWDDKLVKDCIIEYLHKRNSSSTSQEERDYLYNKFIPSFKDKKQFSQSIPAGTGTANDVSGGAVTSGDGDHTKKIYDAMRVGYDNICPITKQPCDDECCPPNSICNLSHEGGSEPTANETINEEDYKIGQHEARNEVGGQLGLKQKLNEEKKDWEIVAFIDNRGNIHRSHHYHPDTFASMHKEKTLTIHSVKRLSDNEVFSVGELTDFSTIKSFNTGFEGKMFAHFDFDNGKGCAQEIHQLKKLPTPTANDVSNNMKEKYSTPLPDLFPDLYKQARENQKWMDERGDETSSPADESKTVSIKLGPEHFVKKEKIALSVVNTGFRGEVITIACKRSDLIIPPEKLPAIIEAIEQIVNS